MSTKHDFITRELRGLRQELRSRNVYRYARRRAVLLRPMGDAIYFMPPYLSTPDEIKLMVKAAVEDVDLATC